MEEIIQILMDAGASYEDAVRTARTINQERERTGALTPEENEIYLILVESGVSPEEARQTARQIAAARAQGGTTREEEMASLEQPPSRIEADVPSTITAENQLPYDLGPITEEDVQRLPYSPERDRQTPVPLARSEDTLPRVQDGPVPGMPTPEPSRRPVDPPRTFVNPANEDPEEFKALFVQLFDRLGSPTTFDAKGDTSELNAWASRLEDTEMRRLFAPREFVTRTETRSDEYNNLLKEAQDSTNARRLRVGANIFIYDLFESLEGAGDDFVGDARFNGSGVNHADHIYALNEYIFGEQIDMLALARGETINVGDIPLSNDYALPNVKLSSLADYVKLVNETLYKDVGETRLRDLFDIRPNKDYRGTGAYDRINRIIEDFLGVNSPPARDLFEIPLDWLLPWDSRITSSEAAREEYTNLDRTIDSLGSPRAEDVGGGLIRAGYTEELQNLDVAVDESGRVYAPDKALIQAAQSRIGSTLPPGEAALNEYNQGILDRSTRPFPQVMGPFAAEEQGPVLREGFEGLDGTGYDYDSSEFQMLKDYLKQNYGGFAFFVDLEEEDLMIGLNQYDKPVLANSDEAVRNMHVVQYLFGDYTTHDMSGPAARVNNDQLLFEAVRNTNWYQTTNVSMREWQGGGGIDSKYALVGGANPLETFQFELNIEERREIVGVGVQGSIYEDLAQAARELMGPGAVATIGENRLIMLAAQIDYLGYDTDNVEQRKRLLDSVIRSEEPFQAGTADFSAFRLQRDRVENTARQYYLPITNERRDEYAQKLFTGEYTEADVVAQMRTQAIARYGTSDAVAAALRAGLNMADYFDPYVARMETILDRPVDLMSEFPEVIEMVLPDGTARPMTHAELGEYVRGLPEWGQSDQGQDSARDVVTAIGALFGETA